MKSFIPLHPLSFSLSFFSLFLSFFFSFSFSPPLSLSLSLLISSLFSLYLSLFVSSSLLSRSLKIIIFHFLIIIFFYKHLEKLYPSLSLSHSLSLSVSPIFFHINNFTFHLDFHPHEYFLFLFSVLPRFLSYYYFYFLKVFCKNIFRFYFRFNTFSKTHFPSLSFSLLCLFLSVSFFHLIRFFIALTLSLSLSLCLSEHFENLLGNPPKITHEPITRIISKQLDIKLGPFTQEELDSVLRKIKNRKAAGLDEIPPEVWKTRQFDDILLRHYNAVYNQNPIDRWMKGCILPFPKKGDLGLAKNYRGITLTSIAAKIYNALLRNRIEPKIDIILRKNQNGFRRNRSTTSQILTIRRILEGVRAKNLQATLIFVDFTKAFDSIHRGKMEQILLAYGIPKETVAAITILYRNTKVKVRSPDGDTEYFDIVAGVLQGDTLAPYLFIICLDYVLRTSIDQIKENGFELTKKRSRRYPATTITDADYADDIAILANTPDQAETLLHSLERAAASIGLYVNAHKTEYMCYNQTGDISSLEGTPLKLVDKFTYLGSSVESTEKDIETRLTKAWTAINRLSIIWKSDLTDKMKRSFFQAAVTSILLYGCTTWTLTKRLEKKLDGNYTRMLRAILNKSWQQHPTRHQLYGHLPPITKTIQVRRTRHAGHCWRSRDELIRDVLLWIPTHGRAKAGRPARTYIQQLCEDTGCCPEDLPRAMNDREEWRERVRDIRATSAI